MFSAASSAGRGSAGAGVGTKRNMLVSQRNAELSLQTDPTLLLINAFMAGWEAEPFPNAIRDSRQLHKTETELTS